MSAFAGVRIVDFTQGLPGPMAAMLLGDFEAEVIKVEPPQGDRMAAHPGYLTWNRNKQVVTLDLATPEGLARARELLKNLEAGEFDESGRPRLARRAQGQVKAAPAPVVDESQLGLFGGPPPGKPATAAQEAVLQALASFSVDGSTPLEALVAVAAWKQKLAGA